MKRGSMRAPIPEETRLALDGDTTMHRCIIGNDCNGRIEWNHAITYAGKRISDWFAIVPMCSKHHRQEAQYRDIIKAFILSRIRIERIKELYPKIIL